jgi:hypothetical protein
MSKSLIIPNGRILVLATLAAASSINAFVLLAMP